jgi:hypothetical protein
MFWFRERKHKGMIGYKNTFRQVQVQVMIMLCDFPVTPSKSIDYPSLVHLQFNTLAQTNEGMERERTSESIIQEQFISN